jgi:16S rRNA A1518/A1519 N6-dimethyltransferase RsmA/KsgA/DIM1 with predicted DNA glycosylase/AP lyase activity
VAARGRGRRPRLADGQHFLRPPLAVELVAAAGVGAGDLVVELGAGFGRLTEPLRRAAGRVIAVELDPGLAADLRRRVAGDARVAVVEGDALRVPLPEAAFRVVANVPFGISTALLRRLLDAPRSPLWAADLIVQEGLARKRAAGRPSSLLALGWLPWWELRIDRRLPRGSFQPPPAVDAAVLAARRRARPLLDPSHTAAYRRLLARGFAHAETPLRRSLAVDVRAWKAFAGERGLPAAATPRDLDVWDWVALFRVAGDRRW